MSDTAAPAIDQLAIDTIRFLAVDMVERAQSGHPGAPMGQAPMAYRLWSKHLRHHPANPSWLDRDRFVLSSGHASALVYALLHLSGYDLPLDELKRFRQLGSKTAGHPEHGLAPGVEMTTGPLGQGLGAAVGMAIAQEKLADRFNRDGFELFSHRVWVIASDGDLMEGLSAEASSLAGHLQLGGLNVLYDSNQISIDGSTDLTYSDDVAGRFAAVGWHVEVVDDGNDLGALDAAMEAAAAITDRPSLVIVSTHIGYGSPNKQDSAASHGAPLGADEVRLTKAALGWPEEPPFHVPTAAYEAFADTRKRGARLEAEWNVRLERYREVHPELHTELVRRRQGKLPDDWASHLPEFSSEKPLATRKASAAVINAVADLLPELVGGSADLAGSNGTDVKGGGDFSAANRQGRNLRFGIREHAMGAVLNGMALSGMYRPYAGTFLIFADYMRPAIRLAALMGQPTIYVFTHDSIFLGEDGPTHQPVSQLVALRAIPNLILLRPADAWETAAAWKVALEHRDGPVALSLTRQGLPVLDAARDRGMEGVAHGGYVISDREDEPDVILIATGSEVALALDAHRRLASEGVAARVVSLPSWELFDAQPQAYRDEVLPPSVTARLAIEAGSPLGWERYVGDRGGILAQETFGESAPARDLAERFGYTVNEVVRRVGRLLDDD